MSRRLPRARPPYRVTGVTYDGVRVLAPVTKPSSFTTEEIREAVRKALAERDAG